MKRFLLLLAVAFIFTSGCSDKVGVNGTVKFSDGEPLTQGTVFFRNAEGTRMYQGALQTDGSFALGEIRDGDGIPSGSYTAWIAGANRTDYARDADGNLTGKQVNVVLIDPKYETPETADLSFTIEQKKTRIDILVERP